MDKEEAAKADEAEDGGDEDGFGSRAALALRGDGAALDFAGDFSFEFELASDADNAEDDDADDADDDDDDADKDDADEAAAASAANCVSAARNGGSSSRTMWRTCV